MTEFAFDLPVKSRPLLLDSEVDRLLSTQIIVAWAGESGASNEDKRLGWWRSDLVSEYGGEDLFKRLLPHTWEWAVLQAVREAARRTDAKVRAQIRDADYLISLYSLGFEIDERVDERLQDLKRSGQPPFESLPTLRPLLGEPWSTQAFLDWAEGHGSAEYKVEPTGRRLKGEASTSFDAKIERMVAALVPLADEYPLPYFRSEA